MAEWVKAHQDAIVHVAKLAAVHVWPSILQHLIEQDQRIVLRG